jgi:tetratricopeptide (TPR) repeat protein
MKRFFFLLGVAALLYSVTPAWSQLGLGDLGETDSSSVDVGEEGDRDKGAEELIAEAAILLQDERLLDARTKLLRALEKEPKAYRAHMMLSGYYMAHVGHFRLALQYALQALSLFEEKNGRPPYYSYISRAEHSQLLYLLSQARLNLDDYEGSLKVLDQYVSYDYKDEWYSGTRAWVLMKLNRLPEAVSEARKGLREGAEPGRTLNMLGILLSMTGDRSGSLEVFREAIRYEMSMGRFGSPATPLNNSGEVYKEVFEEPKAIQSWMKATSLPDGCDHVLPALNLALMLIDQLDLNSASRAMYNFESCVAQFPLRNGEEHKALVHLARGRIDYWNGDIDNALNHFNDASERRQWFGKIGTNENDLDVGIELSVLCYTIGAQCLQ